MDYEQTNRNKLKTNLLFWQAGPGLPTGMLQLLVCKAKKMRFKNNFLKLSK